MTLTAINCNWRESMNVPTFYLFVLFILFAGVAFARFICLHVQATLHPVERQTVLNAPATSSKRKPRPSKKKPQKQQANKDCNGNISISKTDDKKDVQKKKAKSRRRRRKLSSMDEEKLIHVSGEFYEGDDVSNGWIQVTSRSRSHRLKTAKANTKVQENSKTSTADIPDGADAPMQSDAEVKSADEGGNNPLSDPQAVDESSGQSADKNKHHFRVTSKSLRSPVPSRASSGYVSDTDILTPLDRNVKRVLAKPEPFVGDTGTVAPEQSQRLDLQIGKSDSNLSEGPRGRSERVVPPGALSCYEDVDASGGTVDCHGCKLQVPSNSLDERTRIYVDRWQRPEVVDGEGLVITPTIQCEPSDLRFKHPVHFTLPVCYMPKDREINVQIEVSYDNVNWEPLCVRRLAPGTKRVVEFDSEHFCRLRGRVSASDAEQLIKYVQSVGYVKRDRTCSNPPLYNLLWCIYDDDEALVRKLCEEMAGDDCYCYDRVLDPDTFFVEAGLKLELSVRCSKLSITPSKKTAVEPEKWRHQITEKCRFQLRQPTMQDKPENDFSLTFTIDAVGEGKDRKLMENMHFRWEKKLLPRTRSSSVMVNTMHVAGGGPGFQISTQQSTASSKTATSPETAAPDQQMFFPAEDRPLPPPSGEYREAGTSAGGPRRNTISATPNGHIPAQYETPRKVSKESGHNSPTNPSPNGDDEPVTSSSTSVYHTDEGEERKSFFRKAKEKMFSGRRKRGRKQGKKNDSAPTSPRSQA